MKESKLWQRALQDGNKRARRRAIANLAWRRKLIAAGEERRTFHLLLWGPVTLCERAVLRVAAATRRGIFVRNGGQEAAQVLSLDHGEQPATHHQIVFRGTVESR